MPPGLWANAASVTDIAISNAPPAASTRNFCFISVSLPLLIARSPRSFLVGTLTKPATEPCYPRLIAELSFKMPTLCSLPYIERKGQDGGPHAGCWSSSTSRAMPAAHSENGLEYRELRTVSSSPH